MKRLNRARRLAAQSPQHFKHAAIVFRGGAIIAEAHNDGKHHAEVRALQHARIWTHARGLTVLSVRVTKRGLLRNARPCENCLRYMHDNGVATVLYSTDEGEIKRLRLGGGVYREA